MRTRGGGGKDCRPLARAKEMGSMMEWGGGEGECVGLRKREICAVDGSRDEGKLGGSRG